MSATVHPIRRELTLAQVLAVVDPDGALHGLIETLLGLGDPATVREAEKAAATADAAERAVASLIRSVESRSPRWHELMLVSEAISRRATRIESAARVLGTRAA
ncbi:hypothetical protein [Sinomonas gamaensis]|uniref:hypothetical protein n=1 Tax=Sinomonas gamaensis TaxID=2565624 RepID=UPI001108AFD7|nr:hypothetical protein [Sinomonas gamaensis]